MARIRSAKPEFWSDPLMCAFPRDIRFTFKGIWEVCADDHGRFLADARVIKGAVWPLDDDVTLKKIESYLTLLAEKGRILLYLVHGVRYGVVVNWLKHQKVSHPTVSRFPEPPRETFPSNSGAIPEKLPNDSVLNGTDRIGGERIGDGTEAMIRAVVREDVEEEPPPPRVVFPTQCQAFLDMFYPSRSEAEKQRYLDVKRQLYDTLDPQHPGPKIRGGTRVKARSAEHLVEECRAVMKDPPRDRDMAIVFVLKRLLNPPKGPSAAEVASDKDKNRLAREDQYHAAMKAAGIEWAKTHSEEYEEIRKRIDSQFRDSLNSLIGRLARESALAQECGRAAGFPDFDTWNREAA